MSTDSSAAPPPGSDPVDSTPPAGAPAEVSPPTSEVPAEGPPAENEGEGEDDFDEYEPLTPELVEEEAIRGDFVLKWAVVLLAFLLGSTRIAETGTLVNVKTGQYLASHGFLPPANDVFSYTAADRPWTNLSWGFDLMASAVYAVGAFAGLSVFKALIAAVIFGIVVSISRPNLPTWWGAICGAIALLACHLRLTAQPALMTLLGTALVLWILHEWQLPGARTKRLWLLVPLLFVWSNFDPRAFIGVLLLVLYASGDSLGSLTGFSVERPAGARKQLWMVTGAAALAMLIHPFGYKALLAPLSLYGTEYPALREYIQGAYVGDKVTPGVSLLILFPMTTPAFWSNLDLAGISALTMLGLAAITFILNAARLELGQLFVFLGFVVLALLCLHELAVATLVACVLAALNGQSWYAATFRQSYSLDMSELVFSRAGRAATVLVFGAIAFFGGTGRLRDISAPRTGYGLDHNLSVEIEDLRKQLADDASFDHQPFNLLLTQGDSLIWIGEQVFADGRATIYYSPDPEKNLLALHTQTRHSFLPKGNEQATSDRKYRPWRSVFDEYAITHVVLRLKPNSPGGGDYKTLIGLVRDEKYWQMVSMGPSWAVLYRNDTKNSDLNEFLDEHKLSFRKEAYQSSDGRSVAARERWIRPPSFYQKYFWSTKQDLPAEVLEALHLVRVASLPGLPARYDDERAAMAYIAIRRAQKGLAEDPDSVAGYLALGQAYQFLAQWDTGAARNGYRTPYSGTRYLQAVAAYNQALVADPDNSTAHLALSGLYQGARRLDLALRHMEALDRILSERLETDPEELLNISKVVGQMRKQVDQVDDQLATTPEGDAGMQQRVQIALSQGCLLRALKELDQQHAQMAGNLTLEQARIQMLIEVGRVEEANAAAEQFAEPAKQAGVRDWANTVALACLPDANYSRAADLWHESIDESGKLAINNLLLSLAPRPSPASPWPLTTTQVAIDSLYSIPEAIAGRRLDLAALYLEEGLVQIAEDEFREALASNPETPGRSLAAYYINELTGKNDVDFLPPSERIPILFAPEAEGEDQADGR